MLGLRMAAEEDAEIAHEVLRTIRQIVRKISEHSKSLYREVGLTVPQLMCLKAIGELDEEHDEVTVVMVAKRLQLSAATVSRIIDRLTRAQLVVRERRSKDRRKVCLSLTPRGSSVSRPCLSLCKSYSSGACPIYRESSVQTCSIRFAESRSSWKRWKSTPHRS